MRLWNLSSFEILETPVMTAQPASLSLERRPGSPRFSRTSSVGVVIRVAALTALSYTVAVAGSASVLTIRQSEVQTVSNIDEHRPPLDVLFGNRFDNAWTRGREDELLNEAAKKSSGARDRDFLNLVHSIQQESLSEDVPRLADEEISKLIRRKV